MTDCCDLCSEQDRGDDMPSSEVNFKIQDEGRLAELGYTQELSREWSLLHNFGASFSIIVRPTRTSLDCTGRANQDLLHRA